MNVARILYPVKVLGPGNRVGIWLCGCSRACKGCSNPELWKRKPEYELPVEAVFSLVQKIAKDNTIDGFTISGGEPMDQAEELAELLTVLESISDDILIYSGYLLEELRERNDQMTNAVLAQAAVLVDGPYVETQNDDSAIRGSSNQRVHILSSKHESKYRNYLSGVHNQIQNFTTANGVVSVGIHHKGWTTI